MLSLAHGANARPCAHRDRHRSQRSRTGAGAPAEVRRHRDFSADFVHTYQGGVLRKQITERGQLLVKKPGKMRWEYTAPEQKLFVSDGVQDLLLHPAGQAGDRRRPCRPTTAQATPTLFLAGKGNLDARFQRVASSSCRPGAAGSRGAEAGAQDAAQPDYDWLVLVVDSGTLDAPRRW